MLVSASKRTLVSILILALSGCLFAAEPADWSNLQALRPGNRIGVIQSNRKRIEGNFVSVSEGGMTLRAETDIALTKEDVVRVYRRPRIGRKTRALIGGAIGLVAGAITYSTVGDRFRNEGGDFSAGEGAAWFGGSAALGAGIGALTGGGYKTIYQVNKLP